MNPLHWIRWKVLFILSVLVGGALAFGLNPLAQLGVNRLGTVSQRVQWRVKDIRLSPWSGQVCVYGFDMSNGAVPTETSPARSDARRIMSAEGVTFHLDMAELLRRRYQGELHVKAPRIVLQRNPDGSMNVDTEDSEAEGSPTDWWATAQKWIEQTQKWDERRRQVAEKIPEKVKDRVKEVAQKKPSPFHVDYSKRVTYPYENVAQFVAKRIVGEGLEVSFVDHSPAGKERGAIPSLKNGKIEISNLSDKPAVYPEPIQWTISGEIDGSPIRLVGTMDQRAGQDGDRSLAKNDVQFDFEADGLPIQLVQFFAGDLLPLRFDQGRLKVAASGGISEWDRLEVRPVFGFRDAVVSKKADARSIAGLDPDMFCRAFNEVGTLEVKDMRVSGTVSRPEVDLGNTLSDLVRSGGKAFARKQLDKGVEMGTAKINQAVGGELEKVGIGKEVLDTGKAADVIKSGLRDRLKGLPLSDKSSSGQPKVRR